MSPKKIIGDKECAGAECDDIDIAASYSRQDTASVVPLLDALTGAAQQIAERSTASVSAASSTARPSRHVGQVKERVRVRATLAAVRPITGGMYESYLHKFRTDEGDALCWFAGSTEQDLPGGVRGELVPGQTYWLRGTVKAHNDDARFGKETVLTRCTVLSDEQIAEEDAKAAKKAERAAKKAGQTSAGTAAAPAPATPAPKTYSDAVPL
jgi:hypothetical protein